MVELWSGFGATRPRFGGPRIVLPYVWNRSDWLSLSPFFGIRNKCYYILISKIINKSNSDRKNTKQILLGFLCLDLSTTNVKLT
jgi:hypothetical protein